MARPTVWCRIPRSAAIRPENLVCHGGDTADCLSQAQARVLHAYMTPLRDRHGHVLYPGWAITNLSGSRGIGYWTTGDTPPDLAQRELPWGSNADAPPRGWMFAHQALTYWLGLGPDAKMATLDVDPHANIAGDKLVAMVNRAMGPGETKDPAKLLPFIEQGRKLIIYHGTSDPAIPAERSIMFYHALATTLHGMPKSAGERPAVSGAGHAALQWRHRTGPVRHAERDRGLGRTWQSAGRDRGKHEARCLGAA